LLCPENINFDIAGEDKQKTGNQFRPSALCAFVGITGFEPVTSTLSSAGWRTKPTELNARSKKSLQKQKNIIHTLVN
jgi:hypothetical protein